MKFKNLAEAMTDRVSFALWVVIIIVGVPQSFLLYQMWDENLTKQIDTWSEALPRSVLTSLVESDYIGAIPQLRLASSTGLFNCISLFNKREEKILESGCSKKPTFMTSSYLIDIKDTEGEIWGKVSIEVNRAAFFIPLGMAVGLGWLGLLLLGLLGRRWAVTRFEKDFKGLTQRVNNIVNYSIRVSLNEGNLSYQLNSCSSKYREEIYLEEAFQALAHSLVSFKSQVEKSALEMAAVREAGIRNAAIATTTQALAHDVRKPFSMFKMIIDAVQGEEDPLEAKQLLSESLPEIRQAMASVNGMISDVLEIGSKSALFAEPANPETLIEVTLNEIFRLYPDSNINMTYNFNHKHKVEVDTLKVGRVFSNIVSNAVQAMNWKGELWFKTRELEVNEKPFTEFCLGNGGSFIPAESLVRLFDAFFTSGKQGGTGLGLAIAQKIIVAHGGQIRCESDVQRGVEFYFTLPRSHHLIDFQTQSLPASNVEILSSFELLRKSSHSSIRLEDKSLEIRLEAEIKKLAWAAGEPLKVLIIDDEAVYRNSLAALVNRTGELKGHIALSFAQTSKEALVAFRIQPALIIQDVDLGANSLNGYELLRELRTQGYKGLICIHSNRTSSDDYKLAVAAGADAVLPKPMSRSHFLQLILQSAENAKRYVHAIEAPSLARLEFALIDDSKIILRSWQRKMAKHALVHTFSSPDEFQAHHSANEGFLERLAFVVTDFYFAEGVVGNGITFAKNLRKQFGKPILLCSNADLSRELMEDSIDKVIPKVPLSWEELSVHLETIKSQFHAQ